jgi:ribonuclease BN (tRNA processing enzyme)
MRMKLHCFGTAGYHPSESRQTSCYFIPEANLILDAGSGLFRVAKHLVSDEVSILLSHAHLDHVFGLTFLLDIIAVTPLQKIHVYGERAKLEAVRKHLFNEHLFPVMPPFVWHNVEDYGKVFRIGKTECRWFPLEHPGGSIGFRLNWESLSFAYITDTTASQHASYWNEIQGVDWLMHECNFSDRWIELAIKTGHSWTSAVLESASHARIQRLILTHINPLAEDSDPLELPTASPDAMPQVPPTFVIAKDSMVIDLSSL